MSITSNSGRKPCASNDLIQLPLWVRSHRPVITCFRKRTLGYLPLAVINANREDRSDRIASTIRHNRARGKHKVEAMSDIVIELKRRNWSDEKIGRELGMDADSVDCIVTSPPYW